MRESYGRFQVLECIPHYPQHFNTAVFRAVDSSTNRLVALQVIWPEDCTIRPDLIAARFPDQALAARKLVHPWIAEFIDFGITGSQGYTLFIAYEWVGGQSLQSLLAAKRPQALASAREILLPIAAALDHGHSQGARHGSLYPGFIWVGDHGRVKLAGYGISQAFGSMAWDYEFSFNGYIAPEAFAPNFSSSPQADQFALAVIAYELLAGQHPFAVKNRREIAPTMQYQPTPVHTINPMLPESVWTPLSRALNKDPQQRFANCGEFVGALL